MTRSELIARLAERFPDQTPLDTKLSVLAILDALSGALARGDRVEIRGFGTFRSLSRPARTGRNPKTGEEVEIPEKRILLFKPAQALREGVNLQALRARTTRSHFTRTTPSHILQLQD